MDEFTAVGSLADPVRRQVYDYVAAQDEPVGREQTAADTGIPLHTARFHLERLVDEGLLTTEFRRLSGRTGPGAGRPAKLYCRAAREVAVSLPPRNYDLVGSVLAAAVASSLDGRTAGGGASRRGETAGPGRRGRRTTGAAKGSSGSAG